MCIRDSSRIFAVLQIPVQLAAQPRWSGQNQGDEIQFVLGEPVDSCENYLIQEKESIEAMMRTWTEFTRTGALVYVIGLTLPSSDPGPRVIQLSALKSGLVGR